jgi:hypothetical protein
MFPTDVTPFAQPIILLDSKFWFRKNVLMKITTSFTDLNILTNVISHSKTFILLNIFELISLNGKFESLEWV